MRRRHVWSRDDGKCAQGSCGSRLFAASFSSLEWVRDSICDVFVSWFGRLEPLELFLIHTIPFAVHPALNGIASGWFAFAGGVDGCVPAKAEPPHGGENGFFREGRSP